MRKIEKNKFIKPSILDLVNCKVKIDEAIVQKGKHKFSGGTYANASVKTVLSKMYNNKCAFCESDTSAGASLQVEHYRPKAKVSDDVKHKGYYWLGYEWSNLLYSCAKCNRNKWNQFPIDKTGTRCYKFNKAFNKVDYTSFGISNISLINEHALLINPELVDPTTYLFFLPSGKVNSRGYEEAKRTISICKLNRRELCLKRKKIRDTLVRKYMKYFSDYKNGMPSSKADLIYNIQDRLIDILEIYAKNESYSMFARQLLINFDFFVANKFQPNEKAILIDAYNQFKTMNTKVWKSM